MINNLLNHKELVGWLILINKHQILKFKLCQGVCLILNLLISTNRFNKKGLKNKKCNFKLFIKIK